MRFTATQKPTSGSVTSLLMLTLAFSMTSNVFSAPIGNTQELALRDSSNNQNNSSPVGYNNHNDDNNNNNNNNAYYNNNQIPNIAPQGAKVIPVQINNPNVPPPTVQNSVSSNDNGQGGMVDIQMPVEEFNAIKMALMNSVTPQGQFQQNQGGSGGSGAIIRPVQIAPGSNPNSDPAPLVPINNNGTAPTSSSSSTASSTSTSTSTQTPTATPSPPASDDSDSGSGSS